MENEPLVFADVLAEPLAVSLVNLLVLADCDSCPLTEADSEVLLLADALKEFLMDSEPLKSADALVLALWLADLLVDALVLAELAEIVLVDALVLALRLALSITDLLVLWLAKILACALPCEAALTASLVLKELAMLMLALWLAFTLSRLLVPAVNSLA